MRGVTVHRSRGWTRPVFGLALFALAGCATSVRNIEPAASYDFARLAQMAVYAEAAYLDDAAIRRVCQPAFTSVYIRTIPETQNKYFLAISTVTQTQLLSVAGTANLTNVTVDADQTQMYSQELEILLHRGFARAARFIYDDVRPRLKPGYSLHLTGHSLGGAEALILGMLFVSTGTTVSEITSFGQPKVTNQAGVERYQTLPITRIVNNQDLIPEVPLDPYKALGPELVLLGDHRYSVVERRPLRLDEVVAVWNALRNRQIPDQYPAHTIAQYRTHLDTLIPESQRVPYPDP